MNELQVKAIVNRNIKDESSIHDIVKLIEDQELDPNALIFEGQGSIYHEALRNNNLPLLKYLLSNNLVSVNQERGDGTKPLDLIVSQMSDPFYNSKWGKIIRYLVDHTEIDVGLSHLPYSYYDIMCKRGYSDLALELLKREPITSRTNKLTNVEMAYLRFGMNNIHYFNIRSSTLNKTDIAEISNVEGGHALLTVPQLQKSFREYCSTQAFDPDTKRVLDKVNASFQKNTAIQGSRKNDFKDLLKKYQEGEMISLYCQAQGHCIAAVLHEDDLYVCNKGFGKLEDYSVGFYKVSQNMINKEMLYHSLQTIEPQKDFFGTFKNDGLVDKVQYAGNCTVASPKKAIHAMIDDVLKRLNPDIDHAARKLISKKIYKDWAEWDRAVQTQDLIASCSDDIPLLESMHMTLSASERYHQSPNHIKMLHSLEDAILAAKQRINDLFRAAENGDIETCLRLIQEGTNVNQTDVMGVTPLHLAAQKGHSELCLELIQQGAIVDLANPLLVKNLRTINNTEINAVLDQPIEQQADPSSNRPRM